MKLLMLISSTNNKSYYTAIQQTNIMSDCLMYITKSENQPHQTIILKSYLDFVIETFSPDEKQMHKICETFR